MASARRSTYTVLTVFAQVCYSLGLYNIEWLFYYVCLFVLVPEAPLVTVLGRRGEFQGLCIQLEQFLGVSAGPQGQ